MRPTLIIARDLDELWFESIKACFDPLLAKKYLIDRGSFEGHYRYQLHGYSGMVEYPETRPLSPIMPEGMTATTTDDYIEKYFCENIMSPERAVNEEYSYCEFIYPHLDGIIEMLAKTPNTNHAVINIGEPFDHNVPDWWQATDGTEEWCLGRKTGPKVYENPPCLRTITWQHYEGKLSISVFFRSWDIFTGLPTNLGGMQLLNEYVCNETGYGVGPMYVYSSGAHVYDFAKEMVEQRVGRKFDW